MNSQTWIYITETEANGIEIVTTQGKLKVFSVYHPPASINLVDNIQQIMAEDSSVILAGDLNAKHTDWNSNTVNSNGRKLSNFINKSTIAVLAPNEPTHYHTDGNGDILDIALIKNISQQFTVTTLDELSSDHQPLIIKMGNSHEKDQYETKTTNWNQFRKLIEKNAIINVKSKYEIDIAVLKFEEQTFEAINEATTTKISTYQPKNLPDEIQYLIKEKNLARKKYHRTLNPEDKKK